MLLTSGAKRLILRFAAEELLLLTTGGLIRVRRLTPILVPRLTGKAS